MKTIRAIFILGLLAVATEPLRATIFTIKKGDVYDEFVVQNNMVVEMTGGSVGNFAFQAGNNGTVNIYDGSLDGYSTRVYTGNVLNMYGGDGTGVGELGSYGGIVNIYGGKPGVVMKGWGGGEVNIWGGIWGDDAMIYAYDPGYINIYGRNLNFDPSGGRYNDGLLTGFWQNDTPFSLNYYDSEPYDLTYQHVILHEIPEPATLLLLGLGAVMVRRKS